MFWDWLSSLRIQELDVEPNIYYGNFQLEVSFMTLVVTKFFKPLERQSQGEPHD